MSHVFRPIFLALPLLVACPDVDPGTGSKDSGDSGTSCDASDYASWEASGCRICDSADPCMELTSVVGYDGAYPYKEYFEAGYATGGLCDGLDEDVLGGAAALISKLAVAEYTATGGTSYDTTHPEDVCDRVVNATARPAPPPLGSCPELNGDTATLGSPTVANTDGACAVADNTWFDFSDASTSMSMNLAQTALSPSLCGCWLEAKLTSTVTDANNLWLAVLYGIANFKTGAVMNGGFCSGTQDQTITVYRLKVGLKPSTAALNLAKYLDSPAIDPSLLGSSAVTVTIKEIEFSQANKTYTWALDTSTGKGKWSGSTPTWASWSSCGTSWWRIDADTTALIDPMADGDLRGLEQLYDDANAGRLVLEIPRDPEESP